MNIFQFLFNLPIFLVLGSKNERIYGSFFWIYSIFIFSSLGNILTVIVYAGLSSINVNGWMRAIWLPDPYNTPTIGVDSPIFAFIALYFWGDPSSGEVQIKGLKIGKIFPFFFLIIALFIPGVSFIGINHAYIYIYIYIACVCGTMIGVMMKYGIFTTCFCCEITGPFQTLDNFCCFRCPSDIRRNGFIETNFQIISNMKNECFIRVWRKLNGIEDIPHREIRRLSLEMSNQSLGTTGFASDRTEDSKL